MLPLSVNTKIKLGTPAHKFATSTCLQPYKMKIRLSENGEYYDYYADCGYCFRCLDNKRNELSTRMFLHSLDYKYVYFVTLTYGSFNLLPFKEHPFLASWLQTVPSYDNHNSLHRYCWTPSLLVQSHLTNYIKRLRKLVPDQISYAGCGEYGEDYQRPHFHLIIWSNVEISTDSFSDAWSFECKRTKDIHVVHKWRGSISQKNKANGYFRFRFGNVQVHDLWKNGSLNFDGRHPGQSTCKDPNKNAIFNFTYVAKYIGKTSPDSFRNNWPVQAILRHQRAYNMYVKDIDKLAEMMPLPSAFDTSIYNSLTYSIDYDKTHFDEIDYWDFSQLVAPFFVSSRRPAIGKSYFIKNCSRFEAENRTIETFMGKTLPFPSYFNRLLKQRKYPLRLRKVTTSGVSPTKDLFPRLRAYMLALREDSRYWFAVRNHIPSVHNSYGAFGNVHAYCLNDVVQYRSPDYCNTLDCIDFLDPTNQTIHYIYFPYLQIFRGFIYDSHIRDYVLVDSCDRIDFCDFVIDLIDQQYPDLPNRIDSLQIHYETDSLVHNDPQSPDEIEKFCSIRKNMQRYYHIIHQNIL